MTNDVTDLVKIQYPTEDPVSLQRSLTQIKELLEDPAYYERIQAGANTLQLAQLTRTVEELQAAVEALQP